MRPHIVVDLATVTWTEPDYAAWPNMRRCAGRCAIRLVERKASRAVTETVLNALETRISGELLRRIEASVRRSMARTRPPRGCGHERSGRRQSLSAADFPRSMRGIRLVHQPETAPCSIKKHPAARV